MLWLRQPFPSPQRLRAPCRQGNPRPPRGRVRNNSSAHPATPQAALPLQILSPVKAAPLAVGNHGWRACYQIVTAACFKVTTIHMEQA